MDVGDVGAGIANSLDAVDGREPLQDPESPQSSALAWILSDRFLAYCSDERMLQRFTMVSLFYSSTGKSWTTKDGWHIEEDECN
jgi:hypothetical protein